MAKARDFTAKSVGDELDGARSTTLDRAVQCAEFTIPYVFREEGSTANDDLAREYVQGYGAKLVNHLVGKFALSILPPSQPFYRLSPTQEALNAIAQDDANAKFEIEKIMAQLEEGILRYINKSRFRGSLYPALRIAMITGDSLIEKIDDKFRVLNMRNYVIKRDAVGNIIQLVVKETLNKEAVPEDIRSLLGEEDEIVDLYTMVYLEEGKYIMFQEIKDTDVIGSESEFDNITDRFISVRWSKIDGEDYGRGYVEEYLGTLTSLNTQLKVINESAVVSAKTIVTVNPNGITKYKDFVKAKNGDAIIGVPTDIGLVRTDKAIDLQSSYSLIQDYKRELSEAFLISGASIRDAERVTAHEVQLVASELEASFGGIYTAIAEDIQIPIIESAMDTLDIDGGDDIDIIITAGVEALGRNVEMSKINTLIQELSMLAQLVGQEQVAGTINVGAITTAMVTNSGVASKDFLYSKQQQDINTMAQKQEAMMQPAIAGGMQQVGQNVAGQV